MRACSTQFYVLEHYLRLATKIPEDWLSSLQIMTRSPRLSMEVDLAGKHQGFCSRLAFLEAGGINVCGVYLKSASSICGSNASTSAIIFPLHGTVDFDINGKHFVSAPGVPFILDPDVEFCARLSPELHLLIVQLSQPTFLKGIRPPQHGDSELVKLLESYLVETAFFRDHQHANQRTCLLGNALNNYFSEGRLETRELKNKVLIGTDRRLCQAFELINDNLKTTVDLEAIAKGSGLSLRNLYYLMRKYTGMTPYGYCQSRRLIKARESLICHHSENPVIADHALRQGFNHAGRFSSYYYDHFGEYPSETLQNLTALKQNAEKVLSVDAGAMKRKKYWYTSSASP
ncbi:hypothetical protein CLH62_17175 [Marinobacter guineae]|uniref:HTH araC/xylS-type domain-containing protein n=1 Tax=Marinobacter guineae TaxID=432303 RepID=A0A2G1VCY5_9GAMM|nr:hypothetical protein CLH62_17175 [Marinobacter guineae]